MRNILFGVAASGAMLSANPAVAQMGPATSPNETAVLRSELEAANARVEALEKRLLALENARLPDPALAEQRGRGAAATAIVQQTAAVAQEPDRKAPAPTDAVETVSRAQQGQYGSRFTLDPGLTYSHFTSARLNLSGFLALDAIFLGLISIDEVEADVVTADVTARYGLTDRLQLDVNVPYIYRRSTFQSGGAGNDASALTDRTVSTNGLGDISAGVGYRLLRETAGRPDVVINARVKGPTGKDPFGIELTEVEGSEGNLQVPTRLSTGTGVWAASAGISVLKTLDPLVVFGSLNYFHNFQRDRPDISEAEGDQPGRVDLGSALQYGLGVAFALNDTSSLSLSFVQRFVRSSRLRLDDDEDGWQRIVGSSANVGLLNIGATFSLSERLALLANLTTGITNDAPDMTFSVRLPYRF
jgi:hypothetical protein